MLIESGQLQDALRIAQHILRFFPHSIHGHCLRGRALLGLGRIHEAAEQFRWVLAADPENVEACIGLATVYQKLGDQQRAVEQLQYAFELFPGDSALRARLNAVVEDLVPAPANVALELSHVALARIYARNDNTLRAKAIHELQAILRQQPQRQDVRLALAELLWQEGFQREAAEESQRVLEILPNALKANLIAAKVWLDNSRPEEAQPYLMRARALDPENEVAFALFGAYSPLPPEKPMLDALEEEAEWLSYATASIPAEASGRAVGESTEMYEKEATLMSEQSPSEEPFEIPDWLKDLGDEILSEEQEAAEPAATPATPTGDAQAELPDWLQALIARVEAGAAEEATTGEISAEIPAWLAEIPTEETGVTTPAAETEVPEVDGLAWLSEATQGPEELPSSDMEAELPEWLREIRRGAPAPSFERTTEESESALTTLPEWLRDETAAEKVAPVQTDELPEWLRGETTTTETAPPALEETPEWLREVEEHITSSETTSPAPAMKQAEEAIWLTEESEVAVPPPASSEAPAPTPFEEEAPLPDWLQELRAAASEQVTAPAEEPSEEGGEEAQLPEWLRQLRAGIAEAPTLGTRELEEDLAKLAIVPPSEVAVPSAPTAPPSSPEPLPEETPTAPLSAPALAVEMAAEASVEVMEEPAAAAIAETAAEVLPTVEMAEETVAAPLPETAAEPLPTPEMVVEAPTEEPVVAPAERLALARKAAASGQWSQALTLYASLIASSELLGSVIGDLEEGIRRHPDDYNGYQLVGDAYAKEGRLADALRAYRLALAKLQQHGAYNAP